MIVFIAKFELLRYSRDGHARLLVICTTLMLLASMVLSIRDYSLSQDQYQENLLQSRLNWESQAEKDPHDAAHDGTYAIEPIYPLAMLDKGIQQYTGQVIHLGAHERKQSTLNQAKDHSGLFRFGELTPNFVLLYLFPILLIFLGYNTFTEEKEAQTIRLLLAQGATTTQLALGKWVALLILMMLLFIVYCLSVVLSYAYLGGSSGIEILEWLIFNASYLIYLIVFVSLIVLVSSRSKSSGKSLVTLLTFWILVTLIIPKLSSNLAGQLYPFPSLQTFIDNINEDQKNGLNGHNFWNEAAQDFQQKVLQEYGVKTIEELPVDYGGLLLAEGEKYESEIYTKHFNLLKAQYHKQRKVFRLSGFLSPFLSVRFLSMSMARTDYNFQWHFEEKAEQYRVVLNTALNMNIAENAKGVERYKANTEVWANAPKFEYQWEASDQIIKDHYFEYSIIFAWMILSFLAMVVFSRKIKVV